MTDGIISVTKLENTSTDYEVYELLTDRLNHINDHIVIFKSINNQGLCYLSDGGYTLDELETHGIEISGRVSDRIDQLLADYYVSRGVGGILYTGFYSEVTRFLDAIEAIYKEFLG